ncbi:MAG: SDR family oxidoreductase [Alphaproteobacteria bacterium]|nr:SDR family oxidoreductase [Alphaproteobacteria bacterium]
MPSVLITGASRGLGLEFAKQYLAADWQVTCTCRKPDQAAELRGLHGNIATYGMDIGAPDQVAALSDAIGEHAYDVLINNAGIYGPRSVSLGGINYDAWRQVLETNVLGQLRVTEAFVDSVARSDRKVIAFISSRMGSIAENSGGGEYIYRSSKACLNAVVKSLSIDLAPRGITVIAFHPGWVQTDMGGASAAITPTESISGMRKVIEGLTPADNGRFFNYDGSELPW